MLGSFIKFCRKLLAERENMKLSDMLIGVAVMAGVTYFTRVITMVLCRKKIENKFLKSFLFYMPYGVLAAMVYPAIFFSTTYLISAIIGTVAAMVLAFLKRGLLTVSAVSIVVVFAVEQIMLAFAG